MEPATGRPCPDVRVSLASPSLGWRGPRGLPWPSDTREATGDMGSRAFKAPSSRPLPPTAGPLLPAPAHRRGRLCTKSPRTRAPCRVPSRTLTRRRHAGTRAAGWRGRSSRRSRGRTRRLQPGFAPRAPRFAGNAFIVLQTYLTRLRSRSFHIKAQMSWASEHLVRFPRGRLARG